MEEAYTNLDKLDYGEDSLKIKLYERLGDASSDLGNFKQALVFYHKMVFVVLSNF